MDITMWLVCANAVVWLGIGGYIALVGARQKSLAAQVRELEQMRDERDE